jgi:hypothetical protein
MGCKKNDKDKKKKEPGMYECKKCGAVAKNKDKICSAKKIKKD